MRGDLKPRILNTARLWPDWRSHTIAEAVGCNAEYVRRVLRLAKLARPGGRKKNHESKKAA